MSLPNPSIDSGPIDRNFRDLNGRVTAQGKWQVWTPTLTNLTLGNGTLTARYCRVGNLVVCVIAVVFGSTSAMGSGPKFTLPVTGTADILAAQATLRLRDDSASAIHRGYLTHDATYGFLGAHTVSGSTLIEATVGSTTPFTWATSDALRGTLIYEAA